LLATLSTPADQLIGAECFNKERPVFPAIWRGERYSHDRIRIAYLSPDLSDHPVAQQIVGLFEEHDRSRFEITAVSFGLNTESDVSRRIRSAVEHFLDVRSESDQKIAELIRYREADIAVDLAGFTQGSRPTILERRPAPIQVNYLGYPGTMGADHIDYILADRTVIPPDDFAFFSEKVAWLPDSFMVTDGRRAISQHAPTRGECGLPDTGFVFCCFNGAYKILPDLFQLWMRLLKATERSVLWLARANPTAMQNLRAEAEKNGVSPERLIFAERTPSMADHLARFRHADLFLDTLPYNGHATASDALWAGVPVLTYLGSTFAGRVAASQLKAIALPELVTVSLEDYERLAVKIAHDPVVLASLKEKLSRHRNQHPLFDTGKFARNIEAAYRYMHARLHEEKAAQHFTL
jgi:predicted O-linked N-acetylglucosamine transferase (SPINDLY family)